MRERRESLSFLSFLPRRERPLLAGKSGVADIYPKWKDDTFAFAWYIRLPWTRFAT